MSSRTTRSASGKVPAANISTTTKTEPQSTKPATKRKTTEAPTTPRKKRQPSAPDDLAPTPAVAKRFAQSNGVHEDEPGETSTDRPIDPRRAAAQLKTPKGSKVAAYTEQDRDVSPSKSHRPKPSTTTGNLLQEAYAHLIKVEPKLKPVIEQYPCSVFTPESLAKVVDPFVSLASSIISQQVSGAAAASIKRKFIGLFHEDVDEDEDKADLKFPSPAEVASKDVLFLKTAGLSLRKAEYIHGLAEIFASGDLTARWLVEASDEDLLEKLISVRGLGRWSVEMFACFALKRMDVFSTGDLGVQRGMAVLKGRDVNKLKAKGGGKWKYMSEKEMLEIAEPFAPYRSLFMWYMWRMEGVDVAAMEKA